MEFIAILLTARNGALLSQLDRRVDQKLGQLRRLIWSFVHNPAIGLPPSTLDADTLLRFRTEALVDRLATEFGLEVADDLGRRQSKKKLESRPLSEIPDLAADPEVNFRTSTVHKVKGENLDAVLYVAKSAHVRALIDGPATEQGRIGYVALTRAGDIFVLAVPDTGCNGSAWPAHKPLLSKHTIGAEL